MTEEQAVSIIEADNKSKKRVNGELLDFPEDGSTWRYYQIIIAGMIKQLAQREAEVRELTFQRDLLILGTKTISEKVGFYQSPLGNIGALVDGFDLKRYCEKLLDWSNTQATAEAHDAKVREQAIRECITIIENSKGYYLENQFGDDCVILHKDVIEPMKALLNKPESEGV